ncbi:MAG: hypothetical protein IKH13_00745 [Clostridia bacterium]|nr:hypothetical protein [Clostridia bacterium]MBR3438019.1 hypothetical protein [Clostridia bacterium]
MSITARPAADGKSNGGKEQCSQRTLLFSVICVLKAQPAKTKKKGNPEYGYYIDDNEVSFEEYTQAEEQLVKEYGLDKAIDSNSQEKYELNSEGIKDYETFEEGISN